MRPPPIKIKPFFPTSLENIPQIPPLQLERKLLVASEESFQNFEIPTIRIVEIGVGAMAEQEIFFTALVGATVRLQGGPLYANGGKTLLSLCQLDWDRTERPKGNVRHLMNK